MNDDNVLPFKRQPRQPGQPADTKMSQRDRVLNLMTRRGPVGVTWIDVSTHLSVSHGSASALLSRLHAEDVVRRLTIRRDGSTVYVLPEHVQDRQVVARKVTNQNLLDDMAAMLRRMYRPCKHRDFIEDRCMSCNIRHLLERYEELRRSSN